MELSKMFGVERETDFMVKSHNRIHRIRKNLLYGHESIYVKLNENQWVELYDAPTIMGMIAAGPDCIINLPPPLTDEQREQLKALYTLEFKFLIKNNDGGAYAYRSKPNKTPYGWYVGEKFKAQVVSWLSVYSLVSWSDPEPFDIGKALGAGE